jgi:hypothetical protein
MPILIIEAILLDLPPRYKLDIYLVNALLTPKPVKTVRKNGIVNASEYAP